MTGRKTTRSRQVIAFLVLALMAFLAAGARADGPPNGAQSILVSTHVRLSFERDVTRVAVADEDIMSFELLSNRDVLVLGRRPGRTTLMVWFADNGTDNYLFHVQRDLSLLEEALKDISQTITVQAAPDRDAVALRGVVPDITYSNAAEEAAQRFG